ncbi:MAG: PAS domain-containing protein [Oscillospiraceae bacterium]|nr:PAS domain-containing protein [Oscillospiraceae bacterium]
MENTELSAFFKSIVEQDRCPVVICNLRHEMIYLNPAARNNYAKHGELVGKRIFDCHNPESNEKIREVVEWFAKSPENNLVFTFRNDKTNKDVYMVALRDENGALIGYYEKHEFRNPETMKKYDLG